MHPSNRNRVPPIQGLSNPQYAEGADRGPIYGDPSVMPDNVPWNQPQGMDDIPAMLTEGEYVVNKEATNMFGPQIEAMNQAGLEARDSGITPPPQQQPQQPMSAPIQKVVQQDRYGNRTEVTYDTAVPPVPEQVPSMFNAGGVAEATHTSNARTYVDWANKGDYSETPWFKPYPGPDPAPQYKPNGPVIKSHGRAGPPYYNTGGSVPQYYGLGDWVSSLFGGEDPNAGYANYTQEKFVDEANNPGRNVAPSAGQYSPVQPEQPSVPGMHQMPDGSMMPDSAHPGASTDAKIANVGNSLGFNTNTGAALGPKAVNQPVIDTKTAEPINVFDEIFEDTLKFEGGYSDNNNDKGGKTNYGITWKTFKRHYPEGTEDQLKNISKAAAKNIYRKDYYEQPGIDKLPVELQHQVFDIATNSGGPTAIRMLQELAGVKQDGILGPETIAAVEAAGITNDQLADRRSQFYSSILDRDPTQEQFIAGWMKRADAFRDGDLGDAARKHYGIDVKEVDTPAWDLDGDGTISSNEEANLQAAGYDAFAPQDVGDGAANAGSTSGQFDETWKPSYPGDVPPGTVSRFDTAPPADTDYDPRNLGGSEGYAPNANTEDKPWYQSIYDGITNTLKPKPNFEAGTNPQEAQAYQDALYKVDTIKDQLTTETDPRKIAALSTKLKKAEEAAAKLTPQVLDDQRAAREVEAERVANLTEEQHYINEAAKAAGISYDEMAARHVEVAEKKKSDLIKIINAEGTTPEAKARAEELIAIEDNNIEIANGGKTVEATPDGSTDDTLADIEATTEDMLGGETGAGGKSASEILKAEQEAMRTIAETNKNTPGTTKEEEKPSKVKSFIVDSLKTAFGTIIGSDGSNADMKKVLGESVAQALILYAGSRALGYSHDSSLGYAVNKGLESGAARNQNRAAATEQRRTWALTKAGLAYPAANVQKYIKSGNLADLGNPTTSGINVNRIKSTNKELLIGDDLVPVVDYDGVEMVYRGNDEAGEPIYRSLAALQVAGLITNVYNKKQILDDTTTVVREALDAIPLEEREFIKDGPTTIATQMEAAIRKYAGSNNIDPADIQRIVPTAVKQYIRESEQNFKNGIPVPGDPGAFIRANLVFAGSQVEPSLYEGASTQRINVVSNRVGNIAQAASTNKVPAELVRREFLTRSQQAFNDLKVSKPKVFKELVVKGAEAASKSGYELTPYIWFLENITTVNAETETASAHDTRNELKQFYKQWADAYVSGYNEDNKDQKKVILK